MSRSETTFYIVSRFFGKIEVFYFKIWIEMIKKNIYTSFYNHNLSIFPKLGMCALPFCHIFLKKFPICSSWKTQISQPYLTCHRLTFRDCRWNTSYGDINTFLLPSANSYSHHISRNIVLLPLISLKFLRWNQLVGNLRPVEMYVYIWTVSRNTVPCCVNIFSSTSF